MASEFEISLAGCVTAHRDLVAAITGLDDARVPEPTALPRWTVGHLLTHLARNADSFTGMFAAAGRGEPGVQYPGGWSQRDADIEAGAARPAAELVADVTDSIASLERAWESASAEIWAAPGTTLAGDVSLDEVPVRRWREVVVHLTDLAPGLGRSAGPAEWPAEFVRLELRRMTMLWASRRPMGLTELPAEARATAAPQRLAWLLGRAEIPGLGPAGVMA